MTEKIDFFFSPHPTAQERRLRAALTDGLAHGSRIFPHDPTPDEPVTLFFSTNIQMPIERVAVYYTTDGTEPSGERGNSSNSSVVLAEPGETIDDTKLGMQVQQWYAILPSQPNGTLVRYRADGWSLRDPQRHWFADNADPVTMPPTAGRIFAYSVDSMSAPEWFYDALIYHIFVDRFSTVSDEPPLQESGEITGFLGGTLRGILEKLDYIAGLGINCIWLSPVFESPTHHGYNPSDYYNVARRYGTNETLRQLISEAHLRGIRVILDFVANHTSDEHPAFIDASTNPESPTAHWYSFGEWPPHGYRTYLLVRNMPELVTEHPEVRRYLIDAALHWLGYFGADGLRLDYVPGPLHAFWTFFQRKIKQHFPTALTLGEITPPVDEVANYAGRMDAYMDFALAKMMRRVFALRKAPLTDLLTFLDERIPYLPPAMARATLLDNHDMHRFLWLADGNTTRLKLAATCQMTLEGTPIIYYGTEVGLSQIDDAHKEQAYARAPMIWDERQDATLLAHYHRLIVIRQSHPVLRHGKRVRVPIENVEAADEDKGQVGAYLRIGENVILVVLNNGLHPARIRIALFEQLASMGILSGTDTILHNLLTPIDNPDNDLIPMQGIVEFEMPAMSALILESRSD